MFEELKEINHRPEPFEYYTADDLWTDEHTSKQMLAYHLNEEVDISSRKGEFINRSVDWIIKKFDLNENKRVADFGCGPGLYCNRLAKCGAKVTGIDFSDRSISYAKDVANREELSIQYINQNYLEYETEDTFDLIMMIMCDFCALSPYQRQNLLSKFYEFLSPEGSLLLDVYSVNAFRQNEEVSSYELNLLNGFWSSEPYYGFLNTFKYDAKDLILDKYTIIEESRTRTVYNWLQHFTPDRLKTEFEQAGFETKEILGDVAGKAFDPESREFAIIGQKNYPNKAGA